jgi:hypothetical protein
LQNGKGRRAFLHNPQACLVFHELENYLQSFKNARLRCNQCWPIETCLSAFDFTKVVIRIYIYHPKLINFYCTYLINHFKIQR